MFNDLVTKRPVEGLKARIVIFKTYPSGSEALKSQKWLSKTIQEVAFIYQVRFLLRFAKLLLALHGS